MLKRIIPAFKFLFTGKLHGVTEGAIYWMVDVNNSNITNALEHIEHKNYDKAIRVLRYHLSNIKQAFPGYLFRHKVESQYQ